MTDPIAAPSSLVKLEELRVRSLMHSGRLQALNDRVKDLRLVRKDILVRIEQAKEEIHDREPLNKALATLSRHLLAVDQVLPTAQAAVEEAGRTAGDRSAFIAAAKHLEKTMADWGLSE